MLKREQCIKSRKNFFFFFFVYWSRLMVLCMLNFRSENNQPMQSSMDHTRDCAGHYQIILHIHATHLPFDGICNETMVQVDV